MNTKRFTILFVGGLLMAAIPARAQDRVEFNRDIRPILSNNCFQCHGPDANTREAGLRLDVRADAVTDRDGVAAIVPGDIEASAVVARINHSDPNKRMPPPDSEREVDEREIALITQWIAEGATYQSHWAYTPPRKAPLPEVIIAEWVRNPIDHFVLAKLESKGLTPNPEADRVTLIRRLSFDLIGLPPPYDEVNAFVNDNRPDAYERLVDRLLASPHFGERMAIYWLDLVRYADTVGYHGDQVRGASGYRGYVIDAFNANLPFDQFTREQVAGDLFKNPTFDQRLATGYNRLNMVTREGGAQEGDYIVRYAADRVRTTASVWLGSSMGCAECHDHKFDPFTMKDFYSFAAFFADIKEKGVQSDGGNEAPFPPFELLPNADQKAKLDEYDAELASLKAVLAEGGENEDAKKELETVEQRRKRLMSSVPHSVITVTAAEPRMTRILPRGNWMDESGAVVTPAIPAFLGEVGAGDRRANRLDLAEWLTSRDNPLTARVFVNRLWYLYFGTGISKALDDVGSQGEWPTHPELLDYLAVEFMDSGWDMKHMVKTIVMSAAYRQSSASTPALDEMDPYNRLIARQSRIRLPAELVRDNALQVSGLLVNEVGGRSVFPRQPAGYYRELNFPTREYEADAGEHLYRRGVYTHWQRTFLHPSLLAFDAPTREECTAERPVSNSPQQALVLLNDPNFVEAARAFAQRIVAKSGDDVRSGIEFAYRAALSRKPSADEAEILAGLYEKHHAEYQTDMEAAQALVGVGDAPLPDGVDVAELAAWTSVTRTIFSLHEMIYRY